MRSSDWSSDVCSSDLDHRGKTVRQPAALAIFADPLRIIAGQIEAGQQMTVAPRLAHGHERYLMMIETLVEIPAGLPFAGAHLSLSHRHAEQRQLYIVDGWATPFFKARARKIGRASCRERLCRYD